MRLGFLGSGTIALAVIEGIEKSTLPVEKLVASTVDMARSKSMAAHLPALELTEDSQYVVDNADIIFVALPGQVCEKVLTGLRFRPEQKLVSFVPTESCAALAAMTGHKVPVCRAVPLPFAAEHKTITPIFPADKEVHAIFAHIGGALDLDSEEDFRMFMMAASFMGVYYAFLNCFDEWLSSKTAKKDEAALYLAKLFSALSAEAVKQEKVDFPKLEREYSTKGGTNEMISRLMQEKGGLDALKKSLDEVLRHISR